MGVTAELPVLQELLAIEQARLRSALALEAKRNIVFPETTVILHDVERLLAKVALLEQRAPGADLPPGEALPEGFVL